MIIIIANWLWLDELAVISFMVGLNEASLIPEAFLSLNHNLEREKEYLLNRGEEYINGGR